MDTSEDINFSKLQKDFISAKHADEKYSRENDAKFRAVHQKVGSYDEFRDIVAASHLQPLDRNDIIGSDKIQQPWNTMCSSSNKNIEIADEVIRHQVIGVVDSCSKFTKAWKQLKTDKEKIDLLLTLDDKCLKNIFECDIPMNVLEDSVKLFNNAACRENAQRIHVVMKSFTQSKRFDLSLKFFSKSDRQHLTELLRQLEELDCNVHELNMFYKV